MSNWFPSSQQVECSIFEQGRIDVMIATMNDLPERRKVIGAVYPNYGKSDVRHVLDDARDNKALIRIEPSSAIAGPPCAI
ncbi:hypothetical protein [Mesorhizobium vachelliae]|uniref:hypothetical protein n=1 Tax=Mesorhizobium vachelliae TaxID=3072309 RepID=UPI002A2470F2|nr:hypothetical protein [Mesorhizobium sp. VK25D]